MKKYFSIGANELDTYCDYALFSIVSIFIIKASPLEIGVLGACYALPYYFLSSRYGKYSDNNNVKPLRAILFLLCALCTPLILGAESMYYVYPLLLFKMSLRVGLNTSMPKLNENEAEAKEFYEISGYLVNVSRVIIPLLIIFVYTKFGLYFVVFLSVIINGIGFLVTVFDKNYSPNIANNNTEAISVDTKKIIYENKTLFMLVSTYIMASISFYLSNDMLSVFFRYIGEKESSIGYIITILGVGGIIGTKIAAFTLENLKVIHVYSASILINAISFTIFGFTDSLVISPLVYYSAILITGISSGISFVSLKLGIRKTVDFSSLSMVTGQIQRISSIVAISLPIIGGLIADIWTIQTPFMITGLLMYIVLIYSIKQSFTTQRILKLKQ